MHLAVVEPGKARKTGRGDGSKRSNDKLAEDTQLTEENEEQLVRGVC